MTITEIFLAIFGGIALGSVISIILIKYLNLRLDVHKFAVEKESQSIIDKFAVEKARMKYKTIKLEKELYKERQKGTKPKTIAKLENRLFIEREKRNKLMALRRRLQSDPNWGGSEGSKIGVGIILGLKYLDGYAETAGENYSVQKYSLEIGLRIVIIKLY